MGLVLVSAALVAGCARHYKITLTNSNVLTTTSKPKLDKTTGAYYFKDAEGKPASLPATRIKQIEPR